MARQSNENIVRVEVTLHKEKYKDVIQAMEEFGSQAGFLKFAARQYIKAQQVTATGIPTIPNQEIPLQEEQENQIPSMIETEIKTAPDQKENAPQKRRLPPGFGQAKSTQLEE